MDPAARRRVVRVVTRRMAVVESRVEFLRTVNPTAAAALLGKRAVLEAKRTGAFRWARGWDREQSTTRSPLIILQGGSRGDGCVCGGGRWGAPGSPVWEPEEGRTIGGDYGVEAACGSAPASSCASYWVRIIGSFTWPAQLQLRLFPLFLRSRLSTPLPGG